VLKKYTYIYVAIFAIFLFALCSDVAQAHNYHGRDADDLTDSTTPYLEWLYRKPKHYEFTSKDTLWNIQGEFPQSWQNQDWDPKRWPEGWKANATIMRLFKGDIFREHYLKQEQIPVLVVGAGFYKISSQDRERSVKLFVRESKILTKGYDIIELVDWKESRIIGSYTKYGMFLY